MNFVFPLKLKAAFTLLSRNVLQNIRFIGDRVHNCMFFLYDDCAGHLMLTSSILSSLAREEEESVGITYRARVVLRKTGQNNFYVKHITIYIDMKHTGR